MFTMVFFTVFLVLSLGTNTLAMASQASLKATYSSMPLAFTANQGQWDNKVQFRASAGGAIMWFSSDGACYQFTRTNISEDSGPISVSDKRYGTMPDEMMDKQPYSFETMMIKATFTRELVQ